LKGIDRILESRVFFLLVLALSFLFLFTPIRIGYNIYDEGIVVYGANRVLDGEIPYRDFWTMYAPGQFYMVALLYRIFGTGLFPVRVYSAVINLLIAVLAYLIVRRFTERKIALLAFIFTALWMGGWGMFYGSPTPAGTFWSLFSILFIVDFLCKRRERSLIIAGLITGITAVFRHDIGGYTFISSTLVLIPYIYLNSQKNLAKTLKIWSKYLVGTIITFLPAVIYFLMNVPIRDLIYDLIIFPSKIFPRVRDLPYPRFSFDFNTFLFYIPIIVYLITIIELLLNVKNLKRFREKEWSTILLVILGILFFNQAWVRSDVPHLLPTIIPAMMLLSSLIVSPLNRIFKKGEPFIRFFFILLSFVLILALYNNALKEISFSVYILPVIVLSLLVLIISMILQFSSFRRRIIYQLITCILCGLILFSFYTDSIENTPITRLLSFRISGLVPLDTERAKGIYVFPGQDYFVLATIKFIQMNTKPDEKIFIGDSRHDRIFVNDIMLYFLCGRHSATRYHELHPGLATTREVQEEIIRELKRNNVRCVVLWNGAENVMEPNESAISTGVTDLDDFIQKNYIPVMTFGPYQIREKITSGEIG